MPDQAEEDELLKSPGALKGRVGRAALCIVGEWRTFGMPAVHEGVELARHVWQADVFMFYHTRYDAVAMAHKRRQNAVACAEETQLLQNYTHVEHLPYDGCKSKATVHIAKSIAASAMSWSTRGATASVTTTFDRAQTTSCGTQSPCSPNLRKCWQSGPNPTCCLRFLGSNYTSG